jgi:uncharacterized protein (TIGR02996 family)
MDPHLPFLKAIAANPADDLPRLVYADFLEETGEPVHVARAHFIRTQIAQDAITCHPSECIPYSEHSIYGSESLEPKSHEQLLVEAFRHTWVSELPDYLQQGGRTTWRRGFPEGIQIGVGYPDAWGHVSVEWFDRHPIQGIHIRRLLGPSAVEWAGRIRWTWITHLKFGPNLGQLIQEDGEETAFFRELMTLPVFTAVRSLDISENRLTDAWLVQFVSRMEGSSFYPILQELNLSRCFQITDAGANALATTRGLPGLQKLILRDIPLSGPAITMLRLRYGDGLVV